MARPMRAKLENDFKSFLLELAVYLVLVVTYCVLVLRFLGTWLADLFHHQRPLYAGVALALIVVQGIALEQATAGLLWLVRRGRKAAR